MNHDKETLEAAEKFSSNAFSRTEAGFENPAWRHRKNCFLAGVAYAREKQEPTPKDKNALSHRIRPNCEAAPWVIEAVKKIENENAKLKAKLEKAMPIVRNAVGTCRNSGLYGPLGIPSGGCAKSAHACQSCIAKEALKELEE